MLWVVFAFCMPILPYMQTVCWCLQRSLRFRFLFVKSGNEHWIDGSLKWKEFNTEFIDLGSWKFATGWKEVLSWGTLSGGFHCVFWVHGYIFEIRFAVRSPYTQINLPYIFVTAEPKRCCLKWKYPLDMCQHILWLRVQILLTDLSRTASRPVSQCVNWLFETALSGSILNYFIVVRKLLDPDVNMPEPS
jgi:hypothetical protein